MALIMSPTSKSGNALDRNFPKTAQKATLTKTYPPVLMTFSSLSSSQEKVKLRHWMVVSLNLVQTWPLNFYLIGFPLMIACYLENLHIYCNFLPLKTDTHLGTITNKYYLHVLHHDLLGTCINANSLLHWLIFLLVKMCTELAKVWFLCMNNTPLVQG